jgi:hypothetical protein
MNDEELGVDIFVGRDGDDRFMSVPEDRIGKEKKLKLEQDSIAMQRANFCRGTPPIVPENSHLSHELCEMTFSKQCMDPTRNKQIAKKRLSRDVINIRHLVILATSRLDTLVCRAFCPDQAEPCLLSLCERGNENQRRYELSSLQEGERLNRVWRVVIEYQGGRI